MLRESGWKNVYRIEIMHYYEGEVSGSWKIEKYDIVTIYFNTSMRIYIFLRFETRRVLKIIIRENFEFQG